MIMRERKNRWNFDGSKNKRSYSRRADQPDRIAAYIRGVYLGVMTIEAADSVGGGTVDPPSQFVLDGTVACTMGLLRHHAFIAVDRIGTYSQRNNVRECHEQYGFHS
jgi:hypothetical protein